MNAPRRKNLAKIIEAIEELKSQLEDQMSDLETLRDEETDYYDNMPEGIQASERGERAECSMEALTEACDTLYDLVSQLEDVTSSIQEAIDA